MQTWLPIENDVVRNVPDPIAPVMIVIQRLVHEIILVFLTFFSVGLN